MSNKELKLKLNGEFLNTLLEAVETCGWDVDYYESSAFVKWVFKLADKKEPKFKDLDE